MNRVTRCALLTLVSLLLMSAHAARAASSTIGILVFDGFLTSDVTAPIEVFGAATKKAWFSSYKVVVISATKKKDIVSEEGLRIVADQTIYDDHKLDVLIVPSAYDMDPFLKNRDLVEFIKKHNRSTAWLASNCSGAFLLGEAGVLNGKRATTWAGGENDLLKAYPKIKVQFDQNFVIDGKVLTSNGGSVSYQAALELLAKLSSEKFAREISESIQFNRLEAAFKRPK